MGVLDELRFAVNTCRIAVETVAKEAGIGVHNLRAFLRGGSKTPRFFEGLCEYLRLHLCIRVEDGSWQPIGKSGMPKFSAKYLAMLGDRAGTGTPRLKPRRTILRSILHRTPAGKVYIEVIWREGGATHKAKCLSIRDYREIMDRAVGDHAHVIGYEAPSVDMTHQSDREVRIREKMNALASGQREEEGISDP